MPVAAVLVHDGLHLLLRLVEVEVEELIGGDTEKGGDGGDGGHVGHGGAVLPLGDGLEGHAQILGQHLLGNVLLLTQGLDLFTEFHMGFPPL